MKIGMNLLLWTACATPAEHTPLLRQIKEWGFDGVEFPMFDLDGSPWGELGKICDDLGLGRTVVAVLPPGANVIGDEQAERTAGTDFLKGCLDASVALGAEVVCGPLYAPVGRLVGRGPTPQEFDRAVQGLQVVGACASTTDVLLSVEPLNRFETYFLNCQADAARLVDAIGMPSVGQQYDTFHANIEEKSIRHAIEAGGQRINHVHVSANDRATPGEDHVPWKETFEALKAVRYDGWLTIEAFGSWLPSLAGATCIWRTLAPSAEHIARRGHEFIAHTWEAAEV
jgi:D-psicose/D-tagatose/L-ribulose 3-epimerase